MTIEQHIPTKLYQPVSPALDILNRTKLPPISRIGNTPLIELSAVTADLPDTVKVYGKAEFMNPSGSVKDRTALQIIVEALRSGALREGMTLIDSTSGNTGIAYAMLGAALGIPVEIAMTASASEERKRMLQSYGVKLSLTDPDRGSDGAQEFVRNKLRFEPEGYFYANQYGNDSNWRAHYQGTGREIIEQTHGRVTHFVAGLGTTGTFVGATRRLKKYKHGILCCSVQPDASKHSIKGLRHMATAVNPEIYDPTTADHELFCSSEEAFEMTKRLAREEGLLVGVSAGANVAAAVELARKIRHGIIVTVLCDSGNRYLSQDFWG